MDKIKTCCQAKLLSANEQRKRKRVAQRTMCSCALQRVKAIQEIFEMNHFSHPRNEPFEKVKTNTVSGKVRKFVLNASLR
jgi:hypothetical protein